MLQAFKEYITIFEQMGILECNFANKDPWYRTPFWHRFAQITSGEHKSSKLNRRPHEFPQAACEQDLRTAFR